MKISTIGLDLAKNVFQVHGVDGAGAEKRCRKLRRGEVLSFFAKLEHCLNGIEACPSVHHWARSGSTPWRAKQRLGVKSMIASNA